MSKLNQVKIPLNLITETPHNWVIIKLPDLDGGNPLYKVFASWAGGYTDGDRWKLNSGIVKVDEDEDFYYFFGYSGSSYKCHKKAYGFATSFGESILNNMIEQAKENSISVEVLEKNNDWLNLIK